MKKGQITLISIVSIGAMLFSGFTGVYLLSDKKIEKVDDKVDNISERVAGIEATISTFNEAKETMEEFNRNSAQILQALKNK